MNTRESQLPFLQVWGGKGRHLHAHRLPLLDIHVTFNRIHLSPTSRKAEHVTRSWVSPRCRVQFGGCQDYDAV